jgi:hypothetical protein
MNHVGAKQMQDIFACTCTGSDLSMNLERPGSTSVLTTTVLRIRAGALFHQRINGTLHSIKNKAEM